MRFNLDEHIFAANANDPDAYTAATATSEAIDTQGYDDALIIMALGTLGTSATGNVQVTECATSDGSFTSITGATFAAAKAVADKVHCGRVKLQGANPTRLRYIKVALTIAEATSDAGTIVLLAKHDRLPIAQTDTAGFSV